MMTKKNIPVVIALASFGLVITTSLMVFGIFSIVQYLKGVVVLTDKADYRPGAKMEVKITNNLNRQICFSSCYPYYFEKKENGWKGYDYYNCGQEDLANNCLEPKQSKRFEFELPSLSAGIHRLAIPVCVSCSASGRFQPESWFYSNSFNLK